MTNLTCQSPEIQKIIDALPITLVSSEEYGTDYSVLALRFLANAAEFTIIALPMTALSVHIAGKKTREKSIGPAGQDIFPSAAILIPAHLETEWTYTGQLEFSVFLFPHDGDRQLAELKDTCAGIEQPIPIFNQLLTALADEFMAPGLNAADKPYLDRLVPVLLEQCLRELKVSASSTQVVKDPHMNRIHAAIKHMHKNLERGEKVADYAHLCGLSTPHFRRLFKEATGVSVHRYLLNLRVEKARQLIINTSMPLSHVQDNCGFRSTSSFIENFKKRYAVTPSTMRKQFR